MKKNITILLLSLLSLSCSQKVTRTGQQKEFTLFTYNVGAFGKYTENSIPDVASVVRNADLVSLNELDSCNRRHNSFQLEELSNALGGRFFLFARALQFGGGSYGNGVLSKSPILKSFKVDLPKLSGSETRVAAVVETKDCVFASTHLDYVTEEAALGQALVLNNWFIEHYGNSSKPVFLCGDMNMEPGSATIATLEKVWTCLTPPDPSYPSGQPRKCIDYIFHMKGSRAVEVLEAGVLTTHPDTDLAKASDHLPTRVVLRF